ncbi:MAG: hypothetical protein IPM46_16540 [Flavobacteriales bacterium]|nr:hypothetical protein [Flavobacteriales bacterium]
MTSKPTSPTRSAPSLLTAVIIWVLTYLVCRIVLQKVGVPPLPGVLLAVLPVLAFAWLVFCFFRSIATMDELERRMHLEAAVCGFTLSLALVMLLGLLGFTVRVNPDDWSHRHLMPWFVIFYLLGLVIARCKYR